jgi:hypothetical protein
MGPGADRRAAFVLMRVATGHLPTVSGTCAVSLLLLTAVAAGPRQPQLLSRRAHFTKGVPFELEVLDSGACRIVITTAGDSARHTARENATTVIFEVTSALSESGYNGGGRYLPPVWHSLGNLSGMPSLADGDVLRPPAAPVTEGGQSVSPVVSQMNVSVDRAQAGAGRWVITASTQLFELRRTFQLEPAPPSLPRKVLVNDSLTSLATQLIGTHVRHHARLISGGAPAAAAVPGRFAPNSCGTENNQGIFGTAFHPSNFGRPDVWMNTTSGGGVALVALDDVFRVHGECWQSAVTSLNPRVTMSCSVSDPPSIRLSDPRLALSPGQTHAMEWAIFPQGDNCSSYWCFINALRHDFGTDKLPVGVNAGTESAMGNAPSFMINKGAHAGNQLPWNGSGWTDRTQVSPMQADPRCHLPDNTLAPIWMNWTDAKLCEYFAQQGVSVISTGNGWVTCQMPAQQYGLCRAPVYGAAFAETVVPDLTAWLPWLLATARRASKALGRAVKTSYYVETHLSTRPGDSTTYHDCRVVDEKGDQVCYKLNASRPHSQPASHLEQPAFWGTLNNSFGRVIVDQVEKVFRLGFNGMWHDDYGEFGGHGGYTFNTFDGSTAFLHPSNLSVQYTAASLALVQLEVEMKIKDITQAAGGFMTCNGAPLTRTEIRRGFGQHVAENAFQQVSEHVQLFTPIMLNRPPGGCDDIDPLYRRRATSMETGLYDPRTGCGAACWNVLAHLDFGVLSELDQVPFPRYNATGGLVRSTLHSYLFPITPQELGEGFVIGTDRLVTKISGTFSNAEAVGAAVFVYAECLEVARINNSDTTSKIEGVTLRGPGEVSLELAPEHQAVVLWTIPATL